MNIAERLYAFSILCLSPLVGLLFLFSPRGRIRLYERFGYWGGLKYQQYLWIHGASLGEMRGIVPLIRAIKNQSPSLSLLVTATSPSAFAALDGLDVESRLLPFDHAFFLKRALKGASINGLIIAETEIWPGLFKFCAAGKIPVAIVNARISDYTIGRYRWLKRLMPWLFSSLPAVLVADNDSAFRFKELGVADVQFFGSMKYDSGPSIDSEASKLSLREELYVGEAALVVLGSLRPGEEDGWFRAWVMQSPPRLPISLIVVPRHLEKVNYFAEKLANFGIPFTRYSELQKTREMSLSVQVILIDTMGLLEKCYSIASLAFIGATLVDIGGHNPMEAAAYGVPLVMGPYDSTVREVTHQLILAGGLIRVQPGQDLRALLAQVAERSPELKAIGNAAQVVWRSNQGATNRVMAFLSEKRFFENSASSYRATI